VSEGRVTYAGTTFDGIVNTATTEGDKTSHLRSTLRGQYLGPCQ
jgi:hypothetical protein